MTAIRSTLWRALAHGANHQPLPKGLDAAWDWMAGGVSRMVPRGRMFLRQAVLVDALAKQYAELTDRKLREKAQELHTVFRRGKDTREHLLHAFALVREVAPRVLGEKPFVVQVAGALTIHNGCTAEMATGEGKTLSATMPAAVAGWRGRGCHIVTFNDYLAQRDAEWMTPIYKFCGLTVSHVAAGMPPPARRAGYAADITYVSNKEATADYLRDQLQLGRQRGASSTILSSIVAGSVGGADRLVMRGVEFAIVDEADSNLIDEGVTPLIISGDGPNPEQVEAFQQAVDIAAQLRRGEHYRLDHRYREVNFSSAGRDRIAELGEPYGGLWHGARRREELVNQALVARELYQFEKQYVVQEGKVVIVDEFTGRLMPDRTWRDGLHQAVEAKEKLTVNPPKDTHARISFQRFFRLYRKLAGMTGTATEARTELWQIYHMPVVVIPTNRPCIRRRMPDRVFATEQAKWQAVVAEIASLHETGRPVLVGTRSVRASEHLSGLLGEHGLAHQVLNAVRHKEEAQIVAHAGQPRQITVATNMAGRGTDIRLGKGVPEKGGLHVLATERHEAGRIDRQLFGRCARQGDPGSAQAFVSLEDELVRRHSPHLSAQLRRIHGRTEREISSALTRRLFDTAQKRAQRLALRQRKGVLKTDNWLDEFLGFAGKEG